MKCRAIFPKYNIIYIYKKIISKLYEDLYAYLCMYYLYSSCVNVWQNRFSYFKVLSEKYIYIFLNKYRLSPNAIERRSTNIYDKHFILLWNRMWIDEKATVLQRHLMSNAQVLVVEWKTHWAHTTRVTKYSLYPNWSTVVCRVYFWIAYTYTWERLTWTCKNPLTYDYLSMQVSVRMKNACYVWVKERVCLAFSENLLRGQTVILLEGPLLGWPGQAWDLLKGGSQIKTHCSNSLDSCKRCSEAKHLQRFTQGSIMCVYVQLHRIRRNAQAWRSASVWVKVTPALRYSLFDSINAGHHYVPVKLW